MQPAHRQLQSKNLRTFRVKEGGLQETDLNEIIRKAESVLAPLLRSNGALELSVTLSQKDLMILAEGDPMVRALLGILGNVLRAMPGGGVLSMHATRVDFTYRSILDGHQYRYGACASLAIAGRGKDGWCNTGNRATGKDAELSVAYRIIRQHQGSIRRERVAGQGVTTTVYLPLASLDGTSPRAELEVPD